jgi:hypothetical protein
MIQQNCKRPRELPIDKRINFIAKKIYQTDQQFYKPIEHYQIYILSILLIMVKKENRPVVLDGNNIYLLKHNFW